MDKKTKIILAIMLLGLGVSCRLLPHAWNFAPIAAVALFAGVYLGGRYAVILPLLAALVSDLFLGFYELPLMLAVYGSYLAIGGLSLLIRKFKKVETIIAGSILSSVIFFLVTNWAVWQFSVWYPKTIAGLIECYTLALPFFRNTLVGDLFYTAVLFGAYEGVKVLLTKRLNQSILVKNS